MRSNANLTSSRFWQIFRLVMISVMVIASTVGFAQTVSAQCVEHPDKKTALKFNNETRFELTFFVDDDDEGVTVASRTSSNELEVASGEHSLRARAVVKGQSVWVWVINEVPAGQVCSWTITDPSAAVAAAISSSRSAFPDRSKWKACGGNDALQISRVKRKEKNNDGQ